MTLLTLGRPPAPARADRPDAPETLAQVLASARDVVAAGWTQGRWTRSLGGSPEHGRSYCLLGAVVVAAGGPRVVESQLTQRSLDLAWHVLRRPVDEPVRFNPGPHARLVQIRQLVAWNDQRGRTRDEVVDLLDRSAARADGFVLPGVPAALSGRSAACP